MNAAPQPSSFQYDVFISYSHHDSTVAEELELLLARQGLRVWRDKKLTETAHRAFIDSINLAHENSARILVLWSEHSVQSHWVKEEAEAARNQNRLVALSLVPFAHIRIPIGFRNLITPTLAQVRANPELLRSIVTAPQEEILRLADLASPNNHIQPPHLNAKHLPATYTAKLYGREKELAQLFADLDNPRLRVVAYDAMGGAGKTALIYRFYQTLKTYDWLDLTSIFIWSFYSQGSSEDKQSHAADFFKAAYAHFHPDGASAPLPDDPRQQGTDLADLVATRKTLLILDGLEPLQYAAGDYKGSRQFGGIKDPGVKELLMRLVDIGNGLTIITTRIKVHELVGNDSFVSRPLDQLPTEAAIELLRDRGIEQYTFPRETHQNLPPSIRAEFVHAIEDLKHHALSLNFAAQVVADQHGGQIKAFAILPPFHGAHIDDQHRDPFRVIRALEAGLYRNLHHRLKRESATEVLENCPPANQLAVLYFLGLFDRPASLDLLPVVYDATPELREAVIPGNKQEFLALIEAAAARRDAISADKSLSDDDHLDARRAFEETFYAESLKYWMQPVLARFEPKQEGNQSVLNALGQLARQNLVSKARLKTAEGGHVEWESLPAERWFQHHVDCHPLIREYFGYQLRTHYDQAYREAQGRLYDHFRFQGLPEEFRDPISYAALVIGGAYPELDPQVALSEGKLPTTNLYGGLVIPTTLIDSSALELKKVARIFNRPSFPSALTDFCPETSDQMEPLYDAIIHGCHAGRHDECFSELYWPRVSRGEKYFSSRSLALFGQDLSAVASFFDIAFRTPNNNLRAYNQALILNLAAFHLRAIGRLRDATDPLRTVVELLSTDHNWKDAAINACNLSELLLNLGYIGNLKSGLRKGSDSTREAKSIVFEVRDSNLHEGALVTAAQAVWYADQSGDLFERMRSRANGEANALFAAGRLCDAEERFREAEALQQKVEPSLPRLYSLQGFLYSDLLLCRNRPREVAERTEYSIPIAKRNNWPLEIGLDLLNQARAESLLNSKFQTSNFGFIKSILDANSEDEIPRGYLARAEILLRAGAPQREIEAALAEAETRARRGPMPLHLADAMLLRSQLAVRCLQLTSARRFRDQAAEFIRNHGYGRREPDLAVLNCELDPCMENFQSACVEVESEGWWHLLPRLQALATAQSFFSRSKWNKRLLQLRRAEAAYHTERDAYLGDVNRRARAEIDQNLQGLSEATIQKITSQTGASAKGAFRSDDLRAHILEVIRNQRQN